ncbi:hypothetical protein D3C71_1616990 [compost metagenome]
MGWARRCSTTMKPAPNAVPASSHGSTAALPQPSTGPRISAQVQDSMLPANSSTPGTSMRRLTGSRDSGTKAQLRPASSRHSGRLIWKAQRQPNQVAIAPPISGASTMVRPMIAPQIAHARARDVGVWCA